MDDGWRAENPSKCELTRWPQSPPLQVPSNALRHAADALLLCVSLCGCVCCKILLLICESSAQFIGERSVRRERKRVSVADVSCHTGCHNRQYFNVLRWSVMLELSIGNFPLL